MRVWVGDQNEVATNIAEPISSGPTMKTAARVEAAAWKRAVKRVI